MFSYEATKEQKPLKYLPSDSSVIVVSLLQSGGLYFSVQGLRVMKVTAFARGLRENYTDGFKCCSLIVQLEVERLKHFISRSSMTLHQPEHAYVCISPRVRQQKIYKWHHLSFVSGMECIQLCKQGGHNSEGAVHKNRRSPPQKCQSLFRTESKDSFTIVGILRIEQ